MAAECPFPILWDIVRRNTKKARTASWVELGILSARRFMYKRDKRESEMSTKEWRERRGLLLSALRPRLGRLDLLGGGALRAALWLFS